MASSGMGPTPSDRLSLVRRRAARRADSRASFLTFFFLLIILGTTDKRAPAGFAPLAIGLSLTLIHLISIPITNTSVNPARSTGQALFVGDWALAQLWVFWLAPLVGAVIAGALYRWLGAGKTE